MKKLNLGCGTDIKEGFINIDVAPLEGVDIVCNLDNEKLPFEDNSIDYVYCRNFLEHVDLPFMLKEIHRVLKPGCELYLTVPHFTSADNYSDPTHINRFSYRTFFFFANVDNNYQRTYYYDFHFDSIAKNKIVFYKPFIYNILIEPFVNINNITKKLYEDTVLRIFPAWYLEVILRK